MKSPTKVRVRQGYNISWKALQLTSFVAFMIGNETLVTEKHSAKYDRTSAKRTRKTSDKSPSFIEKLWEVLNNSDYREAIHWSKDGQSFRVEPKMFYETSLNAREFQNCRFESFLRRLLRWGFERVILEEEFPINAFVYQHASFKSGEPELIKLLSPPKDTKPAAKKPRRQSKKSVQETDPVALSSAHVPPTAPDTMIEESKATSPTVTQGAPQEVVISHLMAAREAAALNYSAAAGLDRNSLLHSLGATLSDPISILLQQRNQLADLVSSNMNSRMAERRSLLTQQLMAQQNEEARLASVLHNRSQMQADALLRSNNLLSNSAAALALAPALNLRSVPRFQADNRALSASARGLFLPFDLNERRDQPLSSTEILDAFRSGQLTMDEAEILLNHCSQFGVDPMSRFFAPR
jgi:hypothetical protein